MNSSMIDCFIEAAHTGSFTKAAENLYFSQQTISRSVSLLEKELNVSLFERTGAGLQLTQMGRHYYAIFKSDAYDRSMMLEIIAQTYEKLNSRIRIGCSEWIYPYGEILDACNSFRKTAGEMYLSMRVFDNQELLQRLMDKALDVILFSEMFMPACRDVEIIRVCADDLRLFGPADLLGENLTDKQLENRRELPILVVPAWEQSYTETIVRYRQVAKIGLPVHRVYSIPNVEASALAMGHEKYLSFSDYRFGYLRKVEHLGSEKLGINSALCVGVPLQTEHKSVHKLIEHMKKALNK